MKTFLSEIEMDLVISFLSGEASADEKKKLEDILLDPLKKEDFDELKHIWETSPQAHKYERYKSNEAFGKIRPAGTGKTRGIASLNTRVALKEVLKIAAIVIILAGSLITWLFMKNRGNFDYMGSNTIVVQYGEKSQVTLSDGTKVWLNSGSKLTYPSTFNGKTREVTLEGEAYFDVKHDREKLFVVNTTRMRVKVLGTAFNVKSYPGDNKVETTLVRGSVVIEKTGVDKKDAPIFLKPGEKATLVFNELPKASGSAVADPEERKINPRQIAIAKVDPLPITSWKEKYLIFDNTSMEDMAIMLERWFGIKVHLDDDTMKEYRYKGKFTHNENIFQVLEVIKITTPVTYEYKNHEITMKLLQKY